MPENNVIDLEKRKPGRPKSEATIIKQEQDRIEREKREKIVETKLLLIGKKYKKLKKGIKLSKSEHKANLKILKYCLDMSVRLLPLAEESYIRWQSERSMYALNALVNQSREIMNDIRMVSNNDKTVEFLIEQALMPGMKLIMQHILNDFSNLKSIIKEQIPSSKAKAINLEINKMLKAQGMLMEDMRKGLQEKINEYFK